MNMKLHPTSSSILILCFLGAIQTRLAHADVVQVAVAANFEPTLRAMTAGFEHRSGHQISITSGATGRFYQQIRRGAPFDVLLAADSSTPAGLEQEGLGLPGTRFTYATGHLALWSREAGYVDAEGGILQHGQFQHMAIANPLTAPYGAAALAVMQQLGIHEQLHERIVQGESIAQAYQFVASGNAELGFVALSQIMVDGQLTSGSAWIVPDAMHQPIRQDAILLQPGASNPAAKALLAYLRTDDARKTMAGYGYTP